MTLNVTHFICSEKNNIHTQHTGASPDLFDWGGVEVVFADKPFDGADKCTVKKFKRNKESSAKEGGGVNEVFVNFNQVRLFSLFQFYIHVAAPSGVIENFEISRHNSCDLVCTFSFR